MAWRGVSEQAQQGIAAGRCTSIATHDAAHAIPSLQGSSMHTGAAPPPLPCASCLLQGNPALPVAGHCRSAHLPPGYWPASLIAGPSVGGAVELATDQSLGVRVPVWGSSAGLSACLTAAHQHGQGYIRASYTRRALPATSVQQAGAQQQSLGCSSLPCTMSLHTALLAHD